MIKRIGIATLVGVMLGLPATVGLAQHISYGGHGEGHHHDHNHGSGFGIHFGDGIGIHYDEDDHDDQHHRRHHHHSDWNDSAWRFVLPYYDRDYHGTYYRDGDVNYYVPRTYATGRHTAAKPIEIEFGGYVHVDDLAARLEKLANDLCLDLHYNYAHNRQYSATYREAYEILQAAKYIHDKEHQGDREEVAHRLEAVDGLFHHVQDDVKRWSRRHRRQVGQGSAGTKLEALEATLHHLMHDVGIGVSHDVSKYPSEVAPPPVD